MKISGQVEMGERRSRRVGDSQKIREVKPRGVPRLCVQPRVVARVNMGMHWRIEVARRYLSHIVRRELLNDCSTAAGAYRHAPSIPHCLQISGGCKTARGAPYAADEYHGFLRHAWDDCVHRI